MIAQKSRLEIEKISKAGRIVAEALAAVEERLRPGVTAKDLEKIVDAFIRHKGGRPAFKGYQDFPAAICVSFNEGVVHGIPGSRRVQPGDLVSVDIGVEFEGYFGDAAITMPVGEVSNEAGRLVTIAKQALEAGVRRCRAGNHLYDISHAIQAVAEKAGFSVVRDYVGHGIGSRLHEEPQIPNFGAANQGPVLNERMVLALEPMLNAGGSEVEVLADKWTVVTKDRSLSAHFEHTVMVGQEGPKILTSL